MRFAPFVGPLTAALAAAALLVNLYIAVPQRGSDGDMGGIAVAVDPAEDMAVVFMAAAPGAIEIGSRAAAIRAAVGASQYCVKTLNGIEAILFDNRAAREQRNSWRLLLDIANAFNGVSRQRIWHQLTGIVTFAPVLHAYAP